MFLANAINDLSGHLIQLTDSAPNKTTTPSTVVELFEAEGAIANTSSFIPLLVGLLTITLTMKLTMAIGDVPTNLALAHNS